MSDYYLIERGKDYPQTYCADISEVFGARERLAKEFPGKVFEKIECDKWFAMKEKSYLAQTVEEVGAEDFDYALNCLPPLAWRHEDGVERFNVSEMTFNRITRQFAKCEGRHFRKYVRHGDRETYMTRESLAPFFRESGNGE